jgi:hypothetical protein
MEPEPIAPRQFQFSLRTVLVLVVLAAAVASLWLSARQHRENLRLRQENTALRNEVGQLTIEPGDENKVHAIAVPVLEARTKRWRVYIPAGRPIGLQVKSKSEYGSGSSWSLLSPGEHTIVASLRKDALDRWEWIIRSSQGSSSGETRPNASAIMEKLFDDNAFGGIGQSTQCVELGADLELLKLESTDPKVTDSVQITLYDGPSGS